MNVNGYKIEPMADLHGANLRGANLHGTNLRGANLNGANLRDADLRGVDLRYANLRDANLRDADLHDANLRFANLRFANLRFAKLPYFQITPKGYPIIGFKKLADESICVLEIPAEAKRTACLVNRKCRAEFAKVLVGSGSTGSMRGGVNYETGSVVYPDSYDDDIRVDCTHGIHFFLTEREAREF